ncbi:hypothetical protein [Pacificibacter marinus]|uniref:hypothetical protein n=1 Tax=Pacificibacter marinus TaxID=658057 RepID=UPI00209140A0|nr:hypothetical protein [Pacificibacter marinus]
MTASDKCTNLIKNVLLCRSHPHRAFAALAPMTAFGNRGYLYRILAGEKWHPILATQEPVAAKNLSNFNQTHGSSSLTVGHFSS